MSVLRAQGNHSPRIPPTGGFLQGAKNSMIEVFVMPVVEWAEIFGMIFIVVVGGNKPGKSQAVVQCPSLCSRGASRGPNYQSFKRVKVSSQPCLKSRNRRRGPSTNSQPGRGLKCPSHQISRGGVPPEAVWPKSVYFPGEGE